MKLRDYFLLISAIVFGHTQGWADSNTNNLEVTSAWVGEDISKADNYYIYNCSEDPNLAGYLAGRDINGVQTPVIYQSMTQGEMFRSEESGGLYKIKRIADKSFLYSDYNGFFDNSSVASNEFSSQARSYEIVKENDLQQTLSLAIGNVYYIRYRELNTNKYRYYRSNGNDGNNQPYYAFSDNDRIAYQWIFISERQYEFRPKLDAIISMVASMNPVSGDSYYNAFNEAVAVQTSPNATTDEMMLKCDALVRAYYAVNQEALSVWTLIQNASSLSTQLKSIAGVAPQNMKDAISRAFVKLVNNASDLATELDLETDGSLAFVYKSYMSESLDQYKENLVKAAALGYNVTGDLYNELLACKTEAQYLTVAAKIRADFVNWLNARVDAGQGFPAGTDLSMLIVNNSFEVGSSYGWTIAEQGHWIYDGNNDVTSSNTNSYQVKGTGVISKDNLEKSITGVDANYLLRCYDINECTDVLAAYNINHGYDVSQEFSGLPAGTYEISAFVGLCDKYDYSEIKDNEKKIYLDVYLNGNQVADGVEQSCTQSALTKISKTITVSSPQDVVKMAVCGHTVEKTIHHNGKKTVKYRIPFLLDNTQLTVISGPVSNMTFDETKDLPVFVSGKTYGNVTVNRTLKPGQWNSLCLPFNMTESEIAQFFTAVKRLSGVEERMDDEGKYLHLSFENSSTMETGRAYLVKIAGESTVSQITVSDKILDNQTNHCVVFSEDDKYTVVMRGNLKVVRGLSVGSVYLQNDNFFVVGEGDKVNMRGFRGWFECYEKITDPNVSAADPYRAVTNLWNLDGEEMEDNSSSLPGIEEAQVSPLFYDLSGRCVDSPACGLYVVNGKKMFIKR